jgi:hypothetical protein
MVRPVPLRIVLVVFACAGAAAVVAQPVGTAFTYQGRLVENGTPATGAYDLELKLFDAPAGGGQVFTTLLYEDVAVGNGLFTVALDFGPAAFAGSARWLEIGVRPGASTGPFTLLSARQELTPAPSAIFGATAPWSGVLGKPAGFADDVDNDSGGDITAVNTPTSGRPGPPRPTPRSSSRARRPAGTPSTAMPPRTRAPATASSARRTRRAASS